MTIEPSDDVEAREYVTLQKLVDYGIPVTVYIRPRGEKRPATIQGRPTEVLQAAYEFINAGGYFTVEELSGMGTSYCGVFMTDEGEDDIAQEIGFDTYPPMEGHYKAFDQMVLDSQKYLKEHATHGEK